VGQQLRERFPGALQSLATMSRNPVSPATTPIPGFVLAEDGIGKGNANRAVEPGRI
jgi:hypothetical protein